MLRYSSAMRGYTTRAACRPFRHALSVAALCLAVALTAGFGGAVVDDGAAGSSHQDASTLSALRSLFAFNAFGAHTAAPAAPHTVAPAAPTAEARVRVARSVESATDIYREARVLSIITPPPTPAPAPASALPPLGAGDRIEVTLSFYYCEASADTPLRGDGGGFCGAMRDGTNVRSGAAACDFAYLGQRFRIEGDPTGRTYVCADTGSAVHGLHRDIWFQAAGEGWQWLDATGSRATIEVVSN